MDFSSIIVVLLLGAAVYFGAKFALKASLGNVAVKSAGSHPATCLQQVIGAASGRGWKVDVQGETVVARKTNSRAYLEFSVQPSGQGSTVTATAHTGAEGLLGLGALTMKRSSILGATS